MAEFKLQLEPAEKIVFASKKLGEEACTTSLKITNSLKERVALKIKCTSNEMFRIRPPVGALKAGESVTVSLQFNAGKTVPDSGKHYFVIYYVIAKDEKKNPRQIWGDHKGDTDGNKKLFIDFKKEGGEEKKDDDKKDSKEEKKDDKKEEKKEEEKKDDKKDEKKDEKKEEKKEDKKEEKKDEKKDEKKEDKKDEKEDEKDDDKKE